MGYGDFIKAVDKYYDFTHKAFEWLFDKIYPEETHDYVNYEFYISPEELKNSAGYRVYGETTPGTIVLYLYNIIADNYLTYNDMKFRIISVLTHELFHLNQYIFKDNTVISTFEVTEDKSDFRRIEHPVMYNTIQFLDKNMYEICREFDILYNKSTIDYFNLPTNCFMLRTNTYIENTPEVFWANIIRDLTSSNELDQKLISIMKSQSRVIIHVKYNGFRGFEDDCMHIKKDGMYYAPSKELLNHARLLREGTNGTYNYDIYRSDTNSTASLVKIEYEMGLFNPIKRLKPCD